MEPINSAPAPMAAAPSGMQPQGVGVRFVAVLIDGIIITVAIVIIQILAGIAGAISAEFVKTVIEIIASIIMVAVSFGYYIYFEGTQGATFGKKAMGLRVVKEDGTPMTMNAAIIRTLLRIIDGLFLYLVGAIAVWTSAKKQRLGDMAAHTLVVKA